MSLTKKHFLKIAEIVSRLTYVVDIDKSDDELQREVITKDDLIKELSDFFKEENANFKADKFEEACYKFCKGKARSEEDIKAFLEIK